MSRNGCKCSESRIHTFSHSGLQWNGLNLNEIEFLLNLTNNLVRFLAKV